MSATKAVGWIGVGKMGAPMAGHLLDAGVGVTVFDARAENIAAMEEAGARAAASIEAVGGACGVIFTSIPDDAALSSVVAALAPAMAKNAILIDTSTVSPKASEEAARALADHGIRYLRAPVSGSTTIAAAAGLTVLVSGDESAWKEAEPLVSHFSNERFYLGPADEARFMKLVLNTLVGASASVLGEAILLGEHGGLDRARMMDVILKSAVSSPLLGYKRETVVVDAATPAFRLDQMVKDFSLILAAANSEHIDMEVSALILKQYEAAAEDGMQGRDFFALVDWIRDHSSRPG
ncbi:NAD(P)-dependent oxidoreductase [Martelella soudanensis]|uniref:NAD(P)-dependent oxidoreductase n=1 Tax=unclassified Martelella TaxID=2629616 RepID=UPI0015DF226E|nr:MULTISPECIES: NAD(P)-dependent oxidoreductase [unclassified Martelella]